MPETDLHIRNAKHLLNHRLISERYFFPRRTPPPAGLRSVRVGIEDEFTLGCAAGHAHQPLTVLYFHGNGEVVSDYLPGYPELFCSLGADLFLAEYRGYGSSSGIPLLGAMLDDVEIILDAVGRPDDEIIVMGRSVGSIYAIELAKRRPSIGGLILESGIADVLERIRLRITPNEMGVSSSELEQACGLLLDHDAKLRRFESPALVLHATHDHLVNITHAERNLQSLGSKEKKLVAFDSGDHNSIFAVNQAAYIAELKRFIGSLQRDTA